MTTNETEIGRRVFWKSPDGKQFPATVRRKLAYDVYEVSVEHQAGGNVLSYISELTFRPILNVGDHVRLKGVYNSVYKIESTPDKGRYALVDIFAGHAVYADLDQMTKVEAMTVVLFDSSLSEPGIACVYAQDREDAIRLARHSLPEAGVVVFRGHFLEKVVTP